MRIIFLGLILLSFEAIAYDCKPKDYSLNMKKSKQELLQTMKAEKREVLFAGFLHEVTSKKLVSSPSKARALSNYLMNTEANQDQRAFIKLLTISSDLDQARPKSLEINEVCDLNSKVNALPKSAE